MQKPAIVSALLILGGAAMLLPFQPPHALQWPAGKRAAVTLSFDDARTSQVDVGIALLNKYKARATFFVNPGNMEKRLQGWKAAASAGHEIASHSTSHPCSVNYPFSARNALEDYTLAKMQQDLDHASDEIERLVGVRPVTFAYPCGQKFVGRGTEVKSYVPLVAAKFLAGRGFRDEHANDPSACDLAQVMGIESDRLTFAEMKALVAEAADKGEWLVFAGHEIGREGNQTTRQDALEQLLAFANDSSNGIWLDTVQAVAKYIQSKRKD